MAMQSQAQSTLRRLKDTNLEVAERTQDVRGREVRDTSGTKIGKVDDLFIDERDKRVRFLEVESGGVLGIGADKLLIPVDAIQSVDQNAVRISQTREHLGGAPRYKPQLVNEEFLDNTYRYYGYAPYWSSGYAYPRWYV